MFLVIFWYCLVCKLLGLYDASWGWIALWFILASMESSN